MKVPVPKELCAAYDLYSCLVMRAIPAADYPKLAAEAQRQEVVDGVRSLVELDFTACVHDAARAVAGGWLAHESAWAGFRAAIWQMARGGSIQDLKAFWRELLEATAKLSPHLQRVEAPVLAGALGKPPPKRKRGGPKKASARGFYGLAAIDGATPGGANPWKEVDAQIAEALGAKKETVKREVTRARRALKLPSAFKKTLWARHLGRLHLEHRST